MTFLRDLLIIAVIGVLALLAFMFSGIYNPAASAQGNAWVEWFLKTTREQSVSRRIDNVQVPNLQDEKLLQEGAEHYAEMCTGCHLAPGMSESEMRAGLTPRPPELAQVAQQIDPRRAFWVIKHGIRMTAMPAWGATHSDDKIWAITAFVKALPGMSEQRYQQLAGSGHGDDDMAEHEHAEGSDHDHGDDNASAAGSTNQEAAESDTSGG